jgi:hypothetical protein
MVQKERALLLILMFALFGCGPKAETEDTSSTAPLFGSIGSEKTYCSTVNNPTTSTTVTATAQYRYRPATALGLRAAATANIRYAEVAVLNSSGTTIQCGETDGNGAISVNIPRTAGTYTLKVFSRADNSHVRASVLNNSTSMTPYSISASFTLTGSETTQAVTLPLASYTDTLEGGAFNILDQIYNANEFIRNNSTCASLGNVCTAFTVAPKVRVFWTPGMSPGAYYGSPTASISFYIATDDSASGMGTGIYLMGGVNGSTCVDTDHYDNSVIIHEYGHFLENAFAYSNSPGGSHNGDSIIDPRLAWSEGWANFLQGAVRGDNHYIDTAGNVDCPNGTGVNVNLNLETITSGQDAVNGSTFLGEGVFREVSVSRVLWDTMESAVGGDGFGANVGFAYIWKIFSDASVGFRNPTIHFRNVGHFNELMRNLISANAPGNLTNYDNLVSNERQRADRREYAYLLTPQNGATCTFTIQGVAGTNNLARTNDFMAYYYDGSAARATLNLKYAATPSGTPTDLDLHVWKENYVLNDTATLVDSSARFYPEANGVGIETVSFSGQPAGYYMIQIQTDQDNVNTTAQYYLETNGGSERLCP